MQLPTQSFKPSFLIFLLGLAVFSLAGCFNSGGSSKSSGSTPSNPGSSGSGSSSGNVFQQAFYDCSRASKDISEQNLFTAICGQHTITFTNNETGVLRISGSLVNWDSMNTGFFPGYYNNWRNFHVDTYMKSDQNLDIDFYANTSAPYPYLIESGYLTSDGEASSQGISYKITKYSTTDYNLKITKKEQRATYPISYDHIITSLDITLDAQGKFKSLTGSIETDYRSTSFTATGKPAANTPFLNI